MGFIHARRNRILRPPVRVPSVVAALLAMLLCATAGAQNSVSKTVAASALSALAVYPEYTAPATVIAVNDSELRSEVSAVVKEIAVDVGQVVNKNDVLVRLERRDFQLAVQREQAELDILQARIEFAQYQVQRAQTLKQQEAVSEELLKQRETDLAVLVSQKQSKQIALQQAKHNLSKCDIRAPFNAVISKKLVSIGELASPGTPLLRVVDAQRREVTAKLQSYQIASLRAASQLYFQNRQRQYPLTIRSVLPVIDPKERTREVRLLFDDARALAGAAGELVWKSNDVHVPAEFLVQRNDRLGIFIVDGNKQARFIMLDNAAEGRPARVELPPETLVVTKGRFRLQDGDTVSVM
jgi:RND family efflux transporter MFP subunit